MVRMICACTPRTIDAIAITVATPSTTPSTVSAERPFACRSHNSLNAKYCEEYARVPTEMMVPMYKPQQDVTNGTARGLSAGQTAAGLNGDYAELVAALLTALETPDAAERWLAGEQVFP